jgi:hypothetical protein
MTASHAVPTAENRWSQQADLSPEQTIRLYLDEHGGATDASVSHLLTTFGIAEGDEPGRDRIAHALAGVGVEISRPLPSLGAGEHVRLVVGSPPAVLVREATPMSRSVVAEAPARRMKRPVTLGALLVSLLVSAVLFGGLATLAVLAINDPGPQGQQGVAGVQGVQGDKGKRGTRGKTGKSGKNGVNGANGSNGAPGATRACSNDVDVPLPYC